MTEVALVRIRFMVNGVPVDTSVLYTRKQRAVYDLLDAARELRIPTFRYEIFHASHIFGIQTKNVE